MKTGLAFLVALAALVAIFFGTAVLAGLWVRIMLDVVAL